MVTISEIEQREKELREIEGRAQEIEKQSVPQRRFGVGVTPQEQQAVVQQKREASLVLQRITEEKIALNEARTQIAENERQRRRGERDARKLEAISDERKRKLIDQGLIPIVRDGKIVGFRDEKTQQTIPIEAIPRIAEEKPEEFRRFSEAGIVTVESTPMEELRLQSIGTSEREIRQSIPPEASGGKQVVEQKLINVVTATSEPRTKLEKQLLVIQRTRERITQETPLPELRTLKQKGILTAAGIVSAVGSAVLFTKQATVHPILTIKAIPSNIKEFKRFASSGQFANLLKTQPEFVTGRIIGEIAIFKATQPILISGPSLIGAGLTKISPTSLKIVQRPLKKFPELKERFVQTEIGEIGLVPEFKPKLPSGIPKKELPPTIRGGFGYSQAEQRKFIGQIGAATSQRGLIKLETISAEIKEIEGMGLFATPGLQTRISRLGGIPQGASLKELITGEEIVFKVDRPQIIAFPKEIVGRKGGFEKITPSSELEAVTISPLKGGPTEIINIKKLGATVINFRRVTIFKAELPGLKGFGKPIKITTIQLQGFRGVIDTQTKPISKVLRPSIRLPTTRELSKLKTIAITRISTRVTQGRREITIIGFPPSRIAPPRASKPISPRIISRLAPRLTPRITRGAPSRRTPRIFPRIARPQRRILPTLIKRKLIDEDELALGFRTFVIRGGKKEFLSGIRTKGGALRVGAQETVGSLRATFGIEKTGLRIPKGENHFLPSQKVFRTFRIQKGRKIPQKDIFIQRTRKEKGLPGGRLQFLGERIAIRQARIKI